MSNILGGVYSLPSERFKHDGGAVIAALVKPTNQAWNEETIPKDWEIPKSYQLVKMEMLINVKITEGFHLFFRLFRPKNVC